MFQLYKIANSYQQFFNLIDTNEEINSDCKEFLDSLSDDLKEKAINLGSLIINLESEEKAIEDAISEMKNRQFKLIKKIDWLKNYLKENLERCEIKEIKSPYFDIKIKFNPISVIVENESIVPSEYFKEVVMRRLDKQTISQELKNNIMILGVFLEKRTRLEIK